MQIQKLLKKQALNQPQKPAIVFEGQSISFAQLKENTAKAVHFLREKGVKPGDKVAVFLPNTLQAVYSLLGLFSLGAVAVPLDFMLTEEEAINFINHSQSKILITQEKKGFDLENVKNKCFNLQEIIIDVGAGLKPAPTDTGFINVDENSLAAIFYTSGSTGHPKGAMLNYSHLDNPPKAIDYFLKLTSQDVFLCGGVPFSHVGGLVYILLTVYFGTTLILMPRFHPFEFLKNIQQHKVSIFCIVPAMFMAILSLKDYQGFDFSSLRYAVVFGAPSSPQLLKRFHSAYPNAQLGNGWGMTETAAPNSLSIGDERIKSIGKFTPDMEVKIIDEAGASLGPDQPGELLVRGKAVSPGYFNEPELTAEAKTSDGWFKTGDIAYFDRDNFYYISGRIKDMIKVAGEIVFSAEVEEKILTHPKVKETAVIGMADKLRGEVPKAFVAAKDGESLDEQELKNFLKEHLAHFKMPHYFEFLKELPKNRTGKIDKTRLI
ncbi:MAG: AMP-binding protein [Candidatus Omnitrophica bacterium]|nr:AMP-binding protein [Candidatus Omnitrophota bacterium]MBU2250701.1 AMP-binding protein [Candidatus Omnitrophota bacterium]